MGTENVKLGVCSLKLGGVDLGLTKGGVEVEVSTNTHKVTVDQFGDSEINEYVMGRTVKITAPLAETTLENLVRIMPGATLVDSGVAQVNTIDIAVVSPSASQTDTITIDGVDYSFVSDADPTEGEIALGLVAAVNADAACTMTASTTATAVDATATVVLTGKTKGDAVTVAVSANLTSTETTAPVVGAKRVDVKHGIGTDLLSLAQELVLHPIALVASDVSEDFIVPLAATAGGLQFAYKLDEERIYNCVFTGYPNASGVLFQIGDKTAV